MNCSPIGFGFVDEPENRRSLGRGGCAASGAPPRAALWYDRIRGCRVNKMDLIAAVADTTDLPKAKAAEVVDAVFGAIEAALKKNEEVRLVGFGSFATAKRKETTGRNPRTGEEINIPASSSVRFKAGKALKDAVNWHSPLGG
jgi:DNA-binding protein HU-beta